MAGDIFLSLFMAIPIVLLTAAFVYYIEKRREDSDQIERRDREATDNRVGPGEARPPASGSTPQPRS